MILEKTLSLISRVKKPRAKSITTITLLNFRYFPNIKGMICYDISLLTSASEAVSSGFIINEKTALL
jgi:hypothetical protein